MGKPTKDILRQGPGIRTLGSAALQAMKQRVRGVSDTMPALPGETFTAQLPARPKDLVRDYLRNVGGEPSSYRQHLPPHLFPQWAFPVVSKTLRDAPYPLLKVLNGGCRVEIKSQIPAGESLDVRARLESIDDNGRRAVLHQSIVTGTKSAPDAMTAHLYAIVPTGGKEEKKAANGQSNGQGKNGHANGNGKPKAKREPARVPHIVDELERWNLREDAGLEFAMLTGDFNPVHWVSPYARAFGFRNTILHGFATMARAWEGLNRRLYSGDVSAIESFDVQFTRPLVLPHRVGLYVDGNDLYVGDAPGGPAYLVGKFTTRE